MPFTPIGSINNELFDNAPSTYLTTIASSAGTTLSVESIRDIAVNNILFIGELGREKSEIIKTHGSTAPSGTTVTLASGLVFDHQIGEKIYVIDYDQIEFSHADTVAGTKTVMTTIDIDPDVIETVYKDETYSSGFYFVRFYNTITLSYSSYSDPIPYAGLADYQVGKILEYAMKRNQLNGFTDFITHEFCIHELNACLQFVKAKLKRWQEDQSFDYDLGNTAQGVYSYTLPTDMWQYSPKSVLAVRIGSKNSKLTYKTKEDFNKELEDVGLTTLAVAATAGDTSITLTDVSDFDDSGTIMISGQEITYTTRSTTTNILSGIPASGTGSITSNLTASSNVWQGDYEEGEPEIFTIYESTLFIYPIPDSDNDGYNVLLDYWKDAPSVDSDYDTIGIARFEMCKYWLTWAIRCQLKNNGIRDMQDGDYMMFRESLADAISNQLKTNNQKYSKSPYVNKIEY